MARTTALALIGALFCAVVLSTAIPASASEPQAAIAAEAGEEQARANQYAGTDGRSPLEDVPVLPLVGVTAGVLVVLSVIAYRRGWV